MGISSSVLMTVGALLELLCAMVNGIALMAQMNVTTSVSWAAFFFAFNKKFFIIVNCVLLAVLSAFILPTLLYFILTSYLHRCFYVAGPGKAVSFFVRGIQYHTAQCCSIDGHILWGPYLSSFTCIWKVIKYKLINSEWNIIDIFLGLWWYDFIRNVEMCQWVG